MLRKSDTRNKRRRKFGKPHGRHSTKKTSKQSVLNCDSCHKLPYQLIPKTYSKNGKACVKFVIRRIPVHSLRGARLCKLSEDSLKFKILNKPISGYRIINLELLQHHVVDITTHVCLCPLAQKVATSGQAPIKLKSEYCKSGLFSIILAECCGCLQQFKVSTSPKQQNGLYDINVRAVWGTVTSGRGPSQLNEVLSTMNIPQMHNTMFTSVENRIGEWWLKALDEEMKKAGIEERDKAIERGDFHHGIPAVTVICDGGWSKRTHKHSYNALGGVGVIFGAETKKLLHIGVRNKHCLVCKVAESNNVTPRQHKCFRNWYETSQAMESDVILEGFLNCESKHGVRYMRIIADGDSSTFSKLQEHIAVWGTDIRKLECANHTCKCVRSNLEKLVAEKKHFKGKGKLSGRNIIRLTTALRCAIKMRSKDKNCQLLKHDIRNSVYHILGFHTKCSNFCKQATHSTPDMAESLSADTTNATNSMDYLFQQQSDFWTMPSAKEMEEARSPCKNQVPLEDLTEIIRDVSVILGRVADKADRLMGNFTTNLAESWMSIRAKFDGGKQINRCSRGSWHTRCYGGALRKNLGPAWSPATFQKCTGMEPGEHYFSFARQSCKKAQACQKYRSTEKYRDVRRKRKLSCLNESKNKKAKLDYGSPLDDTCDITAEQLQDKCDNFYSQKVKMNEEQIKEIETKSRNQTHDHIWKAERRHRLTSSVFGKVMSRRPTNVSSCLVKNLLYTNFKGNINTIRGLAEEDHTVTEYKNLKGNVDVRKVGLCISSEYPYLGTSPDGIVTENNQEGLIEIKNFLQNNRFTIKEAVKKVPNFCLEERDNELKLKQTNEIYYQIQGQLNILNKPWCDFVLRRTNPYDIHVERIYRNKQVWQEMVPKLSAFYYKFLLPELSHPRRNTVSGIRQPKSPWVCLTSVLKNSYKLHAHCSL